MHQAWRLVNNDIRGENGASVIHHEYYFYEERSDE